MAESISYLLKREPLLLSDDGLRRECPVGVHQGGDHPAENEEQLLCALYVINHTPQYPINDLHSHVEDVRAPFMGKTIMPFTAGPRAYGKKLLEAIGKNSVTTTPPIICRNQILLEEVRDALPKINHPLSKSQHTLCHFLNRECDKHQRLFRTLDHDLFHRELVRLHEMIMPELMAIFYLGPAGERIWSSTDMAAQLFDIAKRNVRIHIAVEDDGSYTLSYLVFGIDSRGFIAHAPAPLIKTDKSRHVLPTQNFNIRVKGFHRRQREHLNLPCPAGLLHVDF